MLDLLCGLQDTHCFLQLDLVDFDPTHSMLELSIVDKFTCVIYILTLMKGGKERGRGREEGGKEERKEGGREGGREVTEGRGNKDAHVHT